MGEDRETVAIAKAAVRAMNAQRRFPEGTTPACRHVAMMAEALAKHGTCAMLADEPRHCAISLAATVRMLWEARAVIRALPSATQDGVRVKPLVWTDVSEPTEEIRYHHIKARSSLGEFTIEWKGWKDHDSPTVYLNGNYVICTADLETAKAQAFVHLRDVILAALEPAFAPLPPAPEAALRAHEGGAK